MEDRQPNGKTHYRFWQRCGGYDRNVIAPKTAHQQIDYIHNNPVKAKLVRSAKDYYWTGFRSFYEMGDEPLAVDHDWWWPEDAEKLSKAMKRMGWYGYHKRRDEKD